MSITEKILDLLKKENLTIKEIAQKTGVKDTTIRSNINKLKKDRIIEEVGKRGNAIILSIISKEKEIRKESMDLIENPKFIDSLIFTFVCSYNKPSYSKIQRFLTSLGIIEKNILTSIIRNVEKQNLKIENVPEGDFTKVLNILIKNEDNIRKYYPLTMTFQEAYSLFEELGIRSFQEFMTLMLNLSKRYPEFVIPSASRTGQNFDLLTFKQIFIEQINFKPSGAWSVN